MSCQCIFIVHMPNLGKVHMVPQLEQVKGAIVNFPHIQDHAFANRPQVLGIEETLLILPLKN